MREYSFDMKTVFTDADGGAIAEFTVQDSMGADFGNVENGIWSFKSSKLGEKTLTFTAKGSSGAEASVTKKVEFFKESVPPVFVSETLTVTDVTSGSAKISWSEATDESGIRAYNVYYAPVGSEKVKINLDSSVRTADLTELLSGVEYHVYVEAVDTYGNINVKRLEAKFTTSGGSDGGKGGGNGFVSGGGFNVSSQIINTPIPEIPVEDGGFTDLGDYTWAEKAVYRLVEKAVVKGVTETTFEPGKNVTRAEFAAMLVRALKLSADVQKSFADVPENSWYYEVVGTAWACGLILGDGENFYPDSEMTRQDMIVITCRGLEGLGLLNSAKLGEVCNDMEQVSDYAAEAVAKLMGNGIIQGDTNGNVNPRGFATRAETAVMIDRILS